MSDGNPSDYVDTGMEPPPRLMPPEYRPQGGEALDRLFAVHRKRMEEWSGYAFNRGQEISAQKEQTARRISQRRASQFRER